MAHRRLLGAILVIFAPAWAQAGDAPRDPAPQSLALVDRITWGVSPSAAAEVQRLGARHWLDGQLSPPKASRLPPLIQAQIDGMAISQKPMAELVADLAAQNKATNQIADPDQKKAAQQAYQQAMNDLGREAATRSLLRDLYSPDQLKEQMTWFWFNHFNVHLYKRDIRAMVGDYEDQAIRAHALGRFRDLLEATVRHPAMLRYLDNDQNAVGHINENYARELMELHTLGVGSGYSQKDVQELARILTGVGVDTSPEGPKLSPQKAPLLVREGLFEFNPNRHDFGDKVLLGHPIAGSGFAEVEQALDILARDPATARHVSRQIATYFLGDAPPDEVTARMTAAWAASDGDIAQVLRALFATPQFQASLGTKFKDPIHYAVSAVRLAYDQRPVTSTAPIQGWLTRMAEGLYNHETPDGYPMTAAAWNGPGQMAVRFEIARQIGTGTAGLFVTDIPGGPARPPPPQIQAAFPQAAAHLHPTTQQALAQANSVPDWNTLYFASPEFMNR